eukprot:SAG31_NODE_4282_length_3381_cov_2.153870_3_plen_275_part_00
MLNKMLFTLVLVLLSPLRLLGGAAAHRQRYSQSWQPQHGTQSAAADFHNAPLHVVAQRDLGGGGGGGDSGGDSGGGPPSPPSKVFEVTAFDADPTGDADSTAAIQRTFAAAAAYFGNSSSSRVGRAAPLVRFPTGRYRVSDTINISRLQDFNAPQWYSGTVALRIEGEGMPVLTQVGGADRDLLFCDQAWRVTVTKLRFSGGRSHLALGNNNTGAAATIRILDCEFEQSGGASVRHLGPSCADPVCPFPPFVVSGVTFWYRFRFRAHYPRTTGL